MPGKPTVLCLCYLKTEKKFADEIAQQGKGLGDKADD